MITPSMMNQIAEIIRHRHGGLESDTAILIANYVNAELARQRSPIDPNGSQVAARLATVLARPIMALHRTGEVYPAIQAAIVHIKRLEEFAKAQEQWEADAIGHESPWFDAMPDSLMEGMMLVQKLRNEALHP